VSGLKISGCILAGGQGTRFGGIDKGLIKFGASTLIEHATNRFSPQVESLIINANRNTDKYNEFGFPVVTDSITTFDGPLQGFYAGLVHSDSDYVAFAPCDCPFFPLDLVQQLAKSLINSRIQISMAVAGGKPQPVFAIVSTDLQNSLGKFLANGGRKIRHWIESEKYATVSFPDSMAFDNINTADDLREAETRLNTNPND
jgi:molybdopterin-guanine dinucleotide biosynthesis protein A